VTGDDRYIEETSLEYSNGNWTSDYLPNFVRNRWATCEMAKAEVATAVAAAVKAAEAKKKMEKQKNMTDMVLKDIEAQKAAKSEEAPKVIEGEE